MADTGSPPEAGAASMVVCDLQDGFRPSVTDCRWEIASDLLSRDTQNAPAKPPKFGVSGGIRALASTMPATVNFHDESTSGRCEVSDKGADNVLPAEGNTEPAASKLGP